MRVQLHLLALLLFFPLIAVAQFQFIDTFSDNQRNPLFTFFQSNNAFDFGETNGKLRLTKNEALGSVVYRSIFALSGRFSVQVDVSASGQAAAGIRISTTNGLKSIAVFYTSGLVWASKSSPTESLSDFYRCGVAPFRIRREPENGNLLVAESRVKGLPTCFTSSGWDQNMAMGNVPEDVIVELFVESTTSNDSAIADFDNFTITSDAIVDLRGSIQNIEINRAVRICFPTEAGSFYQLQARERIENGKWQSVGDVIVGNGGIRCAFDPTAIEGQRFYKVVASQ